jgi:hypothetical protein
MTAAAEPGDYACVRVTLGRALERLWPVIADFGGVDRWIDGVESCVLEGEGVGAVRTLVRNGATVRERLELLDAERFDVVYAILEPHSLPAKGVRSVISLREVGPAATQISWRSSADSFTAPPDALGARIEAFYRASLKRLEGLVAPDGEASS